MPPQNAELGRPFAVCPAPDVTRAVPSEYYTCLGELFAEIDRRYGLLAQKNEILRDSLRHLHGHTEEVLQMLQHKNQNLQAAQRRIQELEQMAHQPKENAVQMQNLESRLKACEQHISNLEHLFEGMTRTTRDRNGTPLLSEQDGVPELAQSVNELDVGTPVKPEDQ